MTKILPSLMFAGAMSLSALAMAQPPAPDAMGGDFLLRERVIERLELSDEQVSQIRELKENFQAEFPRDENSREAHREAMKALMEAETFDEAAAQALLDEQTERKLAAMRLRYDINQILTEEQRETLQKMQERMQKRRPKGDRDRR